MMNQYCRELKCSNRLPCSVHTYEGKIPDVSAHSRTLLSSIPPFLESRAAVGATAEAVLPHQWIEQHPSFADAAQLIQKNVRGERARSLEELIEVAEQAQPVFKCIMQTIVVRSKMNPDEPVKVNDKPVWLNHEKQFTVLSLAPLKSRARCVEKSAKEYDGDFSKLTDVVRCSVVVYTEEQLELVAQSLASSAHPQYDYKVVQLKNRFKSPPFNGYRDGLYNIVVSCGHGVFHVCEVQLHLVQLVVHKENNHVFYEYFRSYFSVRGAERKLIIAMERICGYGTDVDKMLAAILDGGNLDHLHALRDLVGPALLGDVRLQELVTERVLNLTNSLEAREEHAAALQRASKFEKAECLYREVLLGRRQSDDTQQLLPSINNLAALLHLEGKHVEAEALYREALSRRRQQCGNAHLATFTAIHNLAVVLQAQGKLSETEPLYREELLGRRQQLGSMHPDTLLSINNMATLLRAQGRLEEAEPLFREALSGRRQHFGDVHPQTLSSLNNLAALLQARGKLTEAEPLYREVLVSRRQQLGDAHPDTLNSINNLATLLQDQGRLEEAEPLYREALSGKKQLGEAKVISITNNLATLLQARGKLVEAEPLYREALLRSRQVLGDGHPETVISIENLAKLLQAQGKTAEAQRLRSKPSSPRKRSNTSLEGKEFGVQPFLQLHFDVNKTLLIRDLKIQKSTEVMVNSILAECTWGMLSEENGKKKWTPTGDRPSIGGRPPNHISYAEYLEILFPSKGPDGTTPETQRQKRTQHKATFTSLPEGVNYQSFFKDIINKLSLRNQPEAKYMNPDAAEMDEQFLQRCKLYQKFYAEKKYNIIPSFFYFLMRLLADKRKFSLTLRTFGQDTADVVEEVNLFCMGMHPDFRGFKADGSGDTPDLRVKGTGSFFRSDLGSDKSHLIIGLLEPPSIKDGLASLEGKGYQVFDGFEHIAEFWTDRASRHLSSTDLSRFYDAESGQWAMSWAIRDYYPLWKLNNESDTSGKLMLVDPMNDKVHPIFFDDNVERDHSHIVDVRSLAENGTYEALSFAESKDVFIVKAEPYISISRDDYFIKLLEHCEQNRRNKTHHSSINLFDEKSQPATPTETRFPFPPFSPSKGTSSSKDTCGIAATSAPTSKLPSLPFSSSPTTTTSLLL